jgi:DMSO/TMAO reductase YedYZ molybdopterin-dependent catalytic subunit
VAFSEVAKLVDLQPTAKHVMAHCYGGYTTNVPLELLLQPGCVLAHKHNGEELSPDHGWPVRLLVPMRYGWKSAKWLNGLELMTEDRPGFWEERGYHNEGDPWKQERFWPELTG